MPRATPLRVFVRISYISFPHARSQHVGGNDAIVSVIGGNDAAVNFNGGNDAVDVHVETLLSVCFAWYRLPPVPVRSAGNATRTHKHAHTRTRRTTRAGARTHRTRFLFDSHFVLK